MLPFQIYCKQQNSHSHSCKQWILRLSSNQAFTKIMQIRTSHGNKYHVGYQLALSLFLERSARCGERSTGLLIVGRANSALTCRNLEVRGKRRNLA